MKKAFALLLSLFIVSLFSYLAVEILFTQSLKSNSNASYYLKTQAQFHLQFFKTLILNNTTLNCPQELTLSNEEFDIKAHFSYVTQEENCQNASAIVDIFVHSKSEIFHVNLHERFLKKL